VYNNYARTLHNVPSWYYLYARHLQGHGNYYSRRPRAPPPHECLRHIIKVSRRVYIIYIYIYSYVARAQLRKRSRFCRLKPKGRCTIFIQQLNNNNNNLTFSGSLDRSHVYVCGTENRRRKCENAPNKRVYNYCRYMSLITAQEIVHSSVRRRYHYGFKFIFHQSFPNYYFRPVNDYRNNRHQCRMI